MIADEEKYEIAHCSIDAGPLLRKPLVDTPIETPIMKDTRASRRLRILG